MRLQTYVTLDYLVEMQKTHIKSYKYMQIAMGKWRSLKFLMPVLLSKNLTTNTMGGLARRGHRLTGDVNVVRAASNLRSTCGRPSNASLEKKD